MRVSWKSVAENLASLMSIAEMKSALAYLAVRLADPHDLMVAHERDACVLTVKFLSSYLADMQACGMED